MRCSPSLRGIRCRGALGPLPPHHSSLPSPLAALASAETTRPLQSHTLHLLTRPPPTANLSQDRFIDPHSRDGPLPGGAAARRAASVKSKELSSWDGGKLLSKAVINARHTAIGASVAARKRVQGDPRTLYGKGGGVFGLARLSHHLMEAWMADPTLNDNAMVARWHESRQKAGFKFLVTQVGHSAR